MTAGRSPSAAVAMAATLVAVGGIFVYSRTQQPAPTPAAVCQYTDRAGAVTRGGAHPSVNDPVIKGNIALNGDRIFHRPGERFYAATVIDEAKGEHWFCTLPDAIAAGWRPSQA